MIRRPPRSTRTDTLFPYTTLFRSNLHAVGAAVTQALRQPGKTRGQLVLYTSSEPHLSLAKAARFVGVGHIRALPAAADRRLPAAALREAIGAARAAGLVPMGRLGQAWCRAKRWPVGEIAGGAGARTKTKTTDPE